MGNSAGQPWWSGGTRPRGQWAQGGHGTIGAQYLLRDGQQDFVQCLYQLLESGPLRGCCVPALTHQPVPGRSVGEGQKEPQAWVSRDLMALGGGCEEGVGFDVG